MKTPKKNKELHAAAAAHAHAMQNNFLKSPAKAGARFRLYILNSMTSTIQHLACVFSYLVLR